MQSSFHENSDGTGEIDEMFGSPLLSSASTSSDDRSDSPRVFPRIGDKYQVSVPPFKHQMGCDQLEMIKRMSYKDEKDKDFEQLFVEGLPVPVMQIWSFSPFGNGTSSDNEVHSKESSPVAAITKDCGLSQLDFELSNDRCMHKIRHSGQFRDDKEDSYTTDLKTEFLRLEDTYTDSTLAAENVLDASSSRNGCRRKRGRVGWKRIKKMKVDSNCQVQQLGMHNMREDASSKTYMIVPGRPTASWSKSEEDLFILGLYMFGKDLKAVKRFVETKDMGNILSYYYGKFFKTESYCRWAESRKTRSRKCIRGQRIFSGWRQQELLARLIPHIPEHLKHEVPEVTKAFNDGRVSMEEFVTKLKALVGPNVLVQAVGIGKGNEDITAVLADQTKTNQISSSRSEIPTGRACASLSTEDIIKFLTRDLRLSKAQADDLFWEAVWPRLLARGWHSEQPEDQAVFGLRQPLVFMIPSVQKFSRRDLTKGIHYFDSVSEVLSKVASDPRLLDLETHNMTGVEQKPECLWDSENTKEKNGHEGHLHSYLQPRFNTELFKSFMFTIVDTSLTSQGVEPSRIQERVTLPLDDGSDWSRYVYWETEDTNNLGLLPSEQWKHHTHCPEGDSLNCNSEGSIHVVNHESSGERNEIFGTCEVSTHDQWDCLSSPLKQRKPSTCKKYKEDTEDAGLVESSGSKDQTKILKFDPKEESPELILGASPLEISISLLSSTQTSPERNIKATPATTDWLSADKINYNSQNSRLCRLIPEIGPGLNLPQDQPVSTMVNSVPETSSQALEVSKSEETSYSESNSGHLQEVPNNSKVLRSSSPGPGESHSINSQENNGNALQENVRRQSTRIRPLTARALEAFACGFFSPKRQRKGSEKTLNPYRCRMKSVSKLVQDDLTSSLNACSSESNDHPLGL